MPRAKLGRGPYSKYGIQKAVAAAQKAAAAAPPTPPPEPPRQHEPPLGSVDIDSLAGEALRTYARRAGVSPRDVIGLTEDRLRQNTKLTIANHFDLITEG